MFVLFMLAMTPSKATFSESIYILNKNVTKFFIQQFKNKEIKKFYVPIIYNDTFNKIKKDIGEKYKVMSNLKKKGDPLNFIPLIMRDIEDQKRDLINTLNNLRGEQRNIRDYWEEEMNNFERNVLKSQENQSLIVHTVGKNMGTFLLFGEKESSKEVTETRCFVQTVPPLILPFGNK